MSVICIIPARGGSQRIPKKNIKLFHGKPILKYSIEAAKESQLFDRIYVSTDDEVIGDIAMDAGARMWKRKPSFAADCVGTQEVVQECVNGIRLMDSDVVCCLYATAPLMAVSDLADGYVLLNNGFNIDYVMSVGYPPLQDAAQFYWGMARCFKAGTPLISTRTRMIHVMENRVCDINTPEDWARAEKMYLELKK